MASVIDEQDLRAHVGRLETLLQEIEARADAEVTDRCREAVQVLLEFHAVGLGRMLDAVAEAGASGQALLDEWARDEVVSAMLVLHDLHPHDLESRVAQALEQVRPLLASHGGNVELLNISPQGEVYLKLLGSCHGCPSSQATLKNAIEEAIYSLAGDVAAIHVEGVVDDEHPALPAGFVPLELLSVGQGLP